MTRLDLRACAALIALTACNAFIASSSSAQRPPTRCVAGTPTPRAEESLDTVYAAPPPEPRGSDVTHNLEYPHAEGELLVFPTARGAALLAENARWHGLFRSLGARDAYLAPEVPFYRVIFSPRDQLHVKVDRLLPLPQVGSVRANGCVFPEVTPDDPEYASNGQWALGHINMPDAWDIERGDDGLVIAIIDSAFDHSNPDLSTQEWENSNPSAPDLHGWNFYHGNAVLTDEVPHGTLVAGIIGAKANNQKLIAGINWDARLMDLKIINTNVGYQSGVLSAFAYAIEHDASVINASWTYAGKLPEHEAQIDDANKHGIVIVAAAGNSGSDLDVYSVFPCSYDKPNLICVASSIQSDTLAPDSNYGKTAVELGAPGQDIKSTMGTGTGEKDGTSMAAPHVSGVAALLRARCPDASAAWIVDRLQTGPSVLGAKTKNGKRLDALAALSTGCPHFELRPLIRRPYEWLRTARWPWRPRPHWPPTLPEPVPVPGGPGADPTPER